VANCRKPEGRAVLHTIDERTNEGLQKELPDEVPSGEEIAKINKVMGWD